MVFFIFHIQLKNCIISTNDSVLGQVFIHNIMAKN